MELNKIYNEDCLEGMKRIPDGSVDLVVTDPPYLFDNGHFLSSDKSGTKSILGNSCVGAGGDVYNNMSNFGVDDIFRLLDMMVPKMKLVNMYLCCNETQVPIYGMWARNHGYHLNILTWEKPLSIINTNRFSTNTEYVCRIYDFGTALNCVSNKEFYNKVIHTKTEQNKVHPTQKPVDMLQRFVQLSSKEDDTVLDPFMGSGTTAIACIKEKRNFIGFELNKEYYEKACKRIAAEKSQLTIF